MINTTEFGDLDAGDIYMPLGDISGFGRDQRRRRYGPRGMR